MVEVPGTALLKLLCPKTLVAPTESTHGKVAALPKGRRKFQNPVVALVHYIEVVARVDRQPGRLVQAAIGRDVARSLVARDRAEIRLPNYQVCRLCVGERCRGFPAEHSIVPGVGGVQMSLRVDDHPREVLKVQAKACPAQGAASTMGEIELTELLGRVGQGHCNPHGCD